MNGMIASGEAIAAFWPGLRSFDAAPDEMMPDLLDAQVDCVPVDRLLREIDRVPQRRAFKTTVDGGLHKETNRLVAIVPVRIERHAPAISNCDIM